MKSKWMVREVSVAGTKFFQVYRRTDSETEKDSIETMGGYWTTHGEAAALAVKLNNEEEANGANNDANK